MAVPAQKYGLRLVVSGDVGLCAADAAAPGATAEPGQLCQTFHSLPTAAVAPVSSAAA